MTKLISFLPRIGKTTLDDFLWKLRTTSSIKRTVMIDFKMCCLYVVFDLPGSVETQLGWSGKFCQLLCMVFLPVYTGTNSIKSTKNSRSYKQKTKWNGFYGSRCRVVGMSCRLGYVRSCRPNMHVARRHRLGRPKFWGAIVTGSGGSRIS